MHFRGRSYSPVSEETKERRIGRSQSSSRSSDQLDNSDQKLDNRVSKPFTNPFSNNFYNPYMVSTVNFNVKKKLI